MSVLLHTPVLPKNTVTKPKTYDREPRTSSILLISAAISIAVVMLVFGGMSIAQGGWQEYSICRDKIVGYEQMGLYKRTEDFTAALSYCDLK
jgi:hypothetical protein